MHATELARAIRRKEISPREALESALDRAGTWQDSTRAFSQVHEEEAREIARLRETAVAEGADLGPLHGVPMAVKDLYDVRGWETTGCCRGYTGRRATADSGVVARLRAAGAVIVGKTNQHELAAGGTNAVSACGATRNPWDQARITGGSSGGSGAAVAARVVPAAIGSDTGGSVRIPASLCGVVGLKPTHGRVPMDGAMPLSPSMDTAGPMTVTVEDAALVFAVLAGEPSGFLTESSRPPDGLRVATPGGSFTEGCGPEVLGAAEEARDVLVASGVRPIEVDIPDLTETNAAWVDIAWSEMAAAHGRLLRRPESLHPQTRRTLEYGSSLDAGVVLRARERAGEARAILMEALGEADVLLSPTTPFPALPASMEAAEEAVGEETWSVHRGEPGWLTRAANLAGLPALSLPAGFSGDGLPLGVQLLGRPGEEATLLALGRAFQDATDHHRREPRFPHL